MNVNLNHYIKNAIAFLKSERFLPFLTAQQKQIFAIALAAFGSLGACYAAYRCFNKDVKRIETEKCTLLTEASHVDRIENESHEPAADQVPSEKPSTPIIEKEAKPSPENQRPHVDAAADKDKSASSYEESSDEADFSDDVLREEGSLLLDQDRLPEKKDPLVMHDLFADERMLPPSAEIDSMKENQTALKKKSEEKLLLTPLSNQHESIAVHEIKEEFQPARPLSHLPLPAESELTNDLLDKASVSTDEEWGEDSSSSREDWLDENDLLFIDVLFDEERTPPSSEVNTGDEKQLSPGQNKQETLTVVVNKEENLSSDDALEGKSGSVDDPAAHKESSSADVTAAFEESGSGAMEPSLAPALIPDNRTGESQGVFGWIAGGAAQVVKNGVDYVQAGFNSGLSAISAGNAQRLELKKGIDLYPYVVEAFINGKQQARIGAQAVNDYWNTPGAVYDPFTANLMQGFALEFGPRLHFLLLNGARLIGPEYAGDLAARFNLAGKIGKTMGNHMLQLSNPLGWGTLVMQLTDMGLAIGDFSQTGVLEKLEEEINSFVRDLALKTGKIKMHHFDYMQNFEAQEKARRTQNVARKIMDETKQAYDEELDKFVAQLEVMNITPPGWFDRLMAEDMWYVQYENEYATDQYKLAKANYKGAQKNYEVCTKKLEDISTELEKSEISDREFLTVILPGFKVYSEITQILVNTSKKTLLHFVQEINATVDSHPQIPQVMKQPMQDALNTLLFGNNSAKAFGKLTDAKEAVSELKDGAVVIKNIARDPLGALARILPETVAQKAKEIALPVNNLLGHAAGDALIGALDEEAIKKLGLQNLNLFEKKQLKFDIEKGIEDFEGLSDEYKENLLFALSYSPVNLDDQMQKLMQKAGKKVARMLAKALAARLEELLRERKMEYKAQDLMEKEIQVPLLQKVSRVAAKSLFWTANKGAAAVSGAYHIAYDRIMDIELE